MTGDGRGNGRRAALERHVHDVEPERMLEEPLAGQMRRRAIARRGIIVLAGICLHQRRKLLQGGRGHRRVDRNRFRCRQQQRDGCKAFRNFVRQFFADGRLNDKVLIDDNHGTAVRRRSGRRRGADHPGGPGQVLNMETAAGLGQFLRKDSRDHVVGRTGRVRYDDFDGLRAFGSGRLRDRRRHDDARRDQPRH